MMVVRDLNRRCTPGFFSARVPPRETKQRQRKPKSPPQSLEQANLRGVTELATLVPPELQVGKGCAATVSPTRAVCGQQEEPGTVGQNANPVMSHAFHSTVQANAGNLSGSKRPHKHKDPAARISRIRLVLGFTRGT